MGGAGGLGSFASGLAGGLGQGMQLASMMQAKQQQEQQAELAKFQTFANIMQMPPGAMKDWAAEGVLRAYDMSADTPEGKRFQDLITKGSQEDLAMFTEIAGKLGMTPGTVQKLAQNPNWLASVASDMVDSGTMGGFGAAYGAATDPNVSPETFGQTMAAGGYGAQQPAAVEGEAAAPEAAPVGEVEQEPLPAEPGQQAAAVPTEQGLPQAPETPETAPEPPIFDTPPAGPADSERQLTIKKLMHLRDLAISKGGGGKRIKEYVGYIDDKLKELGAVDPQKYMKQFTVVGADGKKYPVWHRWNFGENRWVPDDEDRLKAGAARAGVPIRKLLDAQDRAQQTIITLSNEIDELTAKKPEHWERDVAAKQLAIDAAQAMLNNLLVPKDEQAAGVQVFYDPKTQRPYIQRPQMAGQPPVAGPPEGAIPLGPEVDAALRTQAGSFYQSSRAALSTIDNLIRLYDKEPEWFGAQGQARNFEEASKFVLGDAMRYLGITDIGDLATKAYELSIDRITGEPGMTMEQAREEFPEGAATITLAENALRVIWARSMNEEYRLLAQQYEDAKTDVDLRGWFTSGPAAMAKLAQLRKQIMFRAEQAKMTYRTGRIPIGSEGEFAPPSTSGHAEQYMENEEPSEDEEDEVDINQDFEDNWETGDEDEE